MAQPIGNSKVESTGRVEFIYPAGAAPRDIVRRSSCSPVDKQRFDMSQPDMRFPKETLPVWLHNCEFDTLSVLSHDHSGRGGLTRYRRCHFDRDNNHLRTHRKSPSRCVCQCTVSRGNSRLSNGLKRDPFKLNSPRKRLRHH